MEIRGNADPSTVLSQFSRSAQQGKAKAFLGKIHSEIKVRVNGEILEQNRIPFLITRAQGIDLREIANPGIGRTQEGKNAVLSGIGAQK